MYECILTCGTFDLFHLGHLNFLKNAKRLGKKLVVGISTDNCNKEKNKFSLMNKESRLEIVKNCKYVDEVFFEETLNDKQKYVDKYKADLFVIGDDWKGKFDFLSCEVKYLPRTKNISSTMIKNNLNSNIWFIELYKLFHNKIDIFLTNLSKNFIFISPNTITFSSLLLFIPIYILKQYKYIFSFLSLFHDCLDRLDGSMARLYLKLNIKRNSQLGAYLDAICDKIYVFLIYYFIITKSYLLFIKCIIHFCSIIIRTRNYYNNSKSIINKATIYGKMSTFLENISFSIYFIFPNLYQYTMFLSILLSIQSLSEKII